MPQEPTVVSNNLAEIIEDMKTPPDVFQKVDFIINKSYLPTLKQFSTVPLDETTSVDPADITCFFPIKRIVFDKEENNLQKLTSVYSSLSGMEATVAMLILGHKDGQTEMLLGICDRTANRVNGAYPKIKTLQNSLFGNFPGCRNLHNHILNGKETRIAINSAFSPNYRALASASCIGSLRGQNRNDKNSAYYQGIEKVIDAMSGKEYTILILALPLQPDDIQAMRTELEDLYTILSAFAKVNPSFNYSEATAVSQSMSNAISDSIGKTRSKTLSVGENTSHTISRSSFQSDSGGVSVGDSGAFGLSSSKANGTSDGTADASGWNRTQADGHSVAVNKSTSVNRTAGMSDTKTRGKSISLHIENKRITEAMNNVTQQLQRIRNGSGIGLFAVSAYFLSDSLPDVRTIASMYKAVVSGDATATEFNGINVWTGEEFKRILKYLKRFQHPVFRLSPSMENLDTTPATVVTAAELAIQMGLPQRSVNGIPVTESVPFGCNIVKLSHEDPAENVFRLGNVYHLGMRLNTEVNLSLDSLTMHSFITGTTGSGKSNTVYQVLNEIQNNRKDVHFLVVEPAKGEYKDAFADRDDVLVYGINPYVTPLIRLNPFRFHRNIHILEHIDRLTNIFNVCWPMEAAMPAILKQGIERAYTSAGWDLQRSVNSNSESLFPDFTDLMREVESILEESQYSAENKGNYIGALCTRIRELTTGLNGMIFTADDILDTDLFEKNAIIDLSRAGSPETKALIMGLIIIRLQEYRQVERKAFRSGLRHVTVLEEAHHLLRSSTQGESAVSSSLLSKSVEILTNAFAEMRSSGEAFIIADQAPGILDKSVIRNTNTKIILRLPDFADRELVGKAMGLSDAQIVELSKLPTGIAVVYQNDWMESVMVQVPFFQTPKIPYMFDEPENDLFNAQVHDEDDLLNALINPSKMDKLIEGLDGDKIAAISRLHLTTRVKIQLIRYLRNTDERKSIRLGRIACDYFNFHEVLMRMDTYDSLDTWRISVLNTLNPSVECFSSYNQDTLLLLICREYSMRRNEFLPIYLELARKLA